MSLGVGNATPFSQGSNYHTVYNHSFRDQVSYNVRQQVKVKCGYCGCWATKGKECTLCGTGAKGATPASTRPTSGRVGASRSSSPACSSRHSSRSVSQYSNQAQPMQQIPVNSRSNFSTSASQFNNTANPRYQNASNQYQATAPKKVKCNYCGIWVQCGKMCSLCRSHN